MPRHEIRPIRIEGNDAFVMLSNGREVVIDADKVHLVEGFNWSANPEGYASRYVRDKGNRRKIYLHRALADTPDGVYVDHIDGDTYNDRSSNLRQCTKSQNAANARKRKDNTSGFKGAYSHQGKWTSQITVDGRSIYLGVHDTPEQAAAAYALAAQKYFGEFARPA